MLRIDWNLLGEQVDKEIFSSDFAMQQPRTAYCTQNYGTVSLTGSEVMAPCSQLTDNSWLQSSFALRQYALAARGWRVGVWEEVAQMDRDKARSQHPHSLASG